MMDDNPFEASFRCGSRQDMSSQNFLYRITIGTQSPAYLQSDPLSILGIGYISTQTQKYTFTGPTDITCAVKVGDGYSTNNSCKIRTCVGTDCSTPQTFVVTPSANKMCTNQNTVTYDIGCNDSSTDYVRCVDWFSSAGDHTLKVNGTVQNLVCTSTRPAGALSDVKTCTISLPSGGVPVTLFSGDANSFQTTIYSLTKDTQAPTGTLEYYTNYSAGTKLDPTQYPLWQKQPITAVITCTDLPGASDGSNCACAPTLQGDTDGLWSLGQRSTNTSIGPDVMAYSRIFYSGTMSPYAVIVRDTAGNQLFPGFTPIVRIDSIPPKVTASISGTTVNLIVSDPVEGGSGLWKASSSVPTGINKSGSVLYEVI
jgi:hypothetical protein